MSSGGVELDRSVDSIRVGSRLRADLGDLGELCASIEAVGLLQPITITPDGILVCGARRLAAVKQLGWQTVKVWVTATVSGRLAQVLAEQHENTLRKPFTPTEAAGLYAELKQLYAADAARRQQASRFTSRRNPRHNNTGADGGADSQAPSATAPGAAGVARRQAARAITGRDSSWSLEHVIEVQRLAEDPASPSAVREVARRELAAMDADGKINGHYLAVKAAVELNDVDQSQPPLELVRAADAAIARVADGRHRSKGSTSAETSRGSDASTSRSQPPVKRYGLRAFLAALEEMDGWWRHYEPAEIAAGLSEEQWQRFCAHLDASNDFAREIAAARASEIPGSQIRSIEQRSRAACG